jgi:hypothetical protein
MMLHCTTHSYENFVVKGFKMTKTVTRMMASVAAMGLVAAPIMAHANTRAGDSSGAYSTSNVLPGLGRAASGEGQGEEGGAGALLLGAAAAGLVVAGIYFASDDEECASPGAC